MDCTICFYRIRRALERPQFLMSNHFTQYIYINYTVNLLFFWEQTLDSGALS